MNDNLPDDHAAHPTPQVKNKRVWYITGGVILFLAFVLSYMFFNVEPKPEELPINNNPTIEQTEQ